MKFFIIFMTLLISINTENVSFRSCDGPNVGKCVIKTVRIEPCPEAAKNEPCKIKRGTSANIAFDYVPNFETDTMSGRVYWSSEIDLPLVGMDTNACHFTTCPIVKGKELTYNFTLPIQRKFPPNIYDIKWRLTGSEDQECCLLTKIQLTR